MRFLDISSLLTSIVVSSQLPPPDMYPKEVSPSPSLTTHSPAPRDTTQVLYPLVPDDEDEVEDAEITLQHLYGVEHVIRYYDQDGNMFWKVDLVPTDTLEHLVRFDMVRFEGFEEVKARAASQMAITTRATYEENLMTYIATPADLKKRSTSEGHARISGQ
jgi:hypothetical protein